MFGCEYYWGSSWWWVFCLIMLILMVGFCFFFMMRNGKGGLMCRWSRSRGAAGSNSTSSSDSAKNILDKRYALGEISGEEYEEKKNKIGDGRY